MDVFYVVRTESYAPVVSVGYHSCKSKGVKFKIFFFPSFRFLMHQVRQNLKAREPIRTRTVQLRPRLHLAKQKLPSYSTLDGRE